MLHSKYKCKISGPKRSREDDPLQIVRDKDDARSGKEWSCGCNTRQIPVDAPSQHHLAMPYKDARESLSIQSVWWFTNEPHGDCGARVLTEGIENSPAIW